MAELTYLTREGYDNLKAELQQLKTQERARIASAIAEAREKGDLSENAEYDAAKEAQSMLELKIAQLEQLLMNARILEVTDVDTDRVYILSFVKIKNMKTNKEITYQIVSAKESDVKSNRISVDSPIGKGLLGRRVGEIVEIQAPSGMLKFEILSISR
jgi:transcription elongation factor GreA